MSPVSTTGFGSPCTHTLASVAKGPVQGGDAQLVVDEVEVDGKDRVAVDLAHGPGGDAPAGEVEGHIPPVVAAHAGGQPELPDHLAEPMQGLLGVAPGGQRHRGEQLHAGPVSVMRPCTGSGTFRMSDLERIAPGPVAPPTPPGDQPAGRAARRSRHALWLIQLHAIEG